VLAVVEARSAQLSLISHSFHEEILAVLDYGHRATTEQIATVLKRRRADVFAAVRGLVHAGKIERRDRRWIRVEEHNL
jgi:predicted transcriptional regulator